MAVYNWSEWGGAAGGALVADYADAKLHRYSAQFTNGELVEVGLIALDAFGLLDKYGGRYPGVSDGAATWAVGALASRFIQRRLTPTVGAIPTTPTGTPAAAPAGTPSGAALAGVPASGGSAAFETAGPGY